jgi:cytoskeleton protein RodZ
MRGKIDINQVESDTKIRAKYLRAMENEEWSLLPGEIYSKTFLRTYADYLGLDSRELLDDYRRQYERPTDHDLRPLTSGRERDRRPGTGRRQQPQPRGGGGFRIPPWVLVLIVLVIVGVALWLVGSLGSGHNGSTTSHTSTTATKHHHHQHKAKAKAKAAKHHAAPTSVHLSLVPTGAVYVCLINGNGRKLINGQQYAAGQKIPVQVAHKLLLTLGTSSMTITANGAKVTVAPSSSPIGIRFTPGKHSSIASGSQPQCS